jgi:O-antigen/teichoic acid export membrane protein
VPTVISNITLSQGGVASPAELARKSRRFAFILLAPLCLVGIGFPSLILRPYGGSYVDGATTTLRVLVVAAVPWSLVIIAQSRFRIEQRFHTVTVLTGCFCVTSLGLPLAFAAPFGSAGMAVGWLLAILASTVLAAGLTSRAERGARITGGPEPLSQPRRLLMRSTRVGSS